MARPTPNGKTIRAARLKAGERKPVGRAPKHFSKDEIDAWNTIVEECHWCDKSHRLWISRAALDAARLRILDDFFQIQLAACRKNKLHESDAFVGDDGKEHPKFTILLRLNEGLRKMLSALGATPAAQVRMMSHFTKTQMPKGSDIEGGVADRGRFLK